MPTIKLQNYSEGVLKSSSVDILTQVIDHSGSSTGITTSDQRKRIKLLDKIEAGLESGEVTFEDEEYKHVQELIDNMKWVASNKIIRDFLKAFS